MNYFKSFSEKIFSGKIRDFDALALDLFHFQSRNNPVYRRYLEARNLHSEAITRLEDIPFLPISFFKTEKIISGPEEAFAYSYSSSGTTGMQTSRHYIWSKEFYLRHSRLLFESVYGSLRDFHVLALLPSYLEREGSSLVAMAAHFIQESGSPHSGFYLNEYDLLYKKLLALKESPKKILLLGVTFALLDLAEQFTCSGFERLLVMETGGMKGRRKEMIREEVHDVLTRAFGVDRIHSEYGMTELLSQAYSTGEGTFREPWTMRIVIRDTYDPFACVVGKSGAINIIDLANFHSCAFLETEDLGKKNADGSFTVLGRMDNSEVRGCNLLIN
ncbi:Acyl-protein synthetase, LuxE [Cyclobacterium xiamenense]|uniref:Acyl-protein synthetase, LuxE n=1 Tax=Cyclobacterium xiamenense TaxID=1297121 RepID=A0A1H6YLJ6_9BACT|nr:acyl transferase [Cyclobacterium xiamenense]SEJ37605.1 Acyl-protein synthetase, LuxE [Cyclobacterium xiamenense]